ncbi:MAG: tetraacyldisaccharide 4'-kinase [Kiritimatiellae bacterium]|nr:tetraacyldisaccharide 4'-kinase [Kiritimatiellia bacterium]
MVQNRLERTENFLVSLIREPTPRLRYRRRERLLLAWLRHLSHIYRSVVQLRLFLYRKGILRHHALGCQVISVGNVTVGGTGKTPVVEVLSRELVKQGRRVAILSRGYKSQKLPFKERFMNTLLRRDGKRPPRIVSDGERLLLNSAMSGDEPYMLATNLPEVAVLVDKNRVKSGRYAINRLGCDTLILDDGFQYLAMQHRLDIVLIDRTNPFGNGHVLPRGILREPIRNIARASFIFLTKSDGRGGQQLKAQVRALNPTAEIIECRHCARHLHNVTTGEQHSLEDLRGMRVVAMSGIAVPSGFERELAMRGADIVERFCFADHHRYTQQELINIVNSAGKLDVDAIVTTEKDAVRFPKMSRCDVPIFFLRVDIEILTGEEDFHACIARICFRKENGKKVLPIAEPQDVMPEEESERTVAEPVPA